MNRPVMAMSAMAVVPARADDALVARSLWGDQCYDFSLRAAPRGQTTASAGEIIIDSQQDYLELFSPTLLRQSCEGLDVASKITPVDFSKETVLGLWARGDCSDRGFTHRVVKDDGRRLLIYSVGLIQSARACLGPGPQGLNLVAIRKVPPGYHVTFEIAHP